MKRNIFLVLLLAISCIAKGQLQLPAEINEIREQLQNASAMSYDYAIEQRLPDGTVNRTKGKAELSKRFYQESNTEQLVIQTDRWFYKLDHASKSIFIIDVRKVRNKLFKGKTSSNPFSVVPDSILLKYGKVDVKKQNGIAKINISFTTDVLINSIYLEYDLTKKIPLVYKVNMKMSYGIDGWNYEEKFMDQILTANNFSLKDEAKKEKLSDYFSYEKGKIRLKKFTQYKLIQQI